MDAATQIPFTTPIYPRPGQRLGVKSKEIQKLRKVTRGHQAAEDPQIMVLTGKEVAETPVLLLRQAAKAITR
jgi:hypothetical protein